MHWTAAGVAAASGSRTADIGRALATTRMAPFMSVSWLCSFRRSWHTPRWRSCTLFALNSDSITCSMGPGLTTVFVTMTCRLMFERRTGRHAHAISRDSAGYLRLGKVHAADLHSLLTLQPGKACSNSKHWTNHQQQQMAADTQYSCGQGSETSFPSLGISNGR